MNESRPIGFVWPQDLPFAAWAGGSETYTLRQMAELQRRSIDTRLIISGQTTASDFSGLDVPVYPLAGPEEMQNLNDTLVFVLAPAYDTGKLKHPSYTVLHNPADNIATDPTLPIFTAASAYDTPASFFKAQGTDGHIPLVASEYMAKHWKAILGDTELPAIVPPPIDPAFSLAQRPVRSEGPAKLLFAGRPAPEKGVYALLAALHYPLPTDKKYQLTCVKTINNAGGTELIHALYDAHPTITPVDACRSAASMAALMAEHDVVIVPSVWEEPFGMLAAEAQHAGCRVVASNNGGLPETECLPNQAQGGLVVTPPNDYKALAAGIARAIELGPLNAGERAAASRMFTASNSVDALLKALSATL